MSHKVSLMFLVAVICAFSLTLRADPKPQSPPEWINGTPPKEFSGNKYMTAVGNGESRSAAVADAKQSLSSVFSQKVESRLNTTSKDEQTENSSGKFEAKSTSDASQTIDIKTDHVLKGVEIKLTYQDPKNNSHYALAVMDRHRVKGLYQLDLNKIKEKISGIYEDQFTPRPTVSAARSILEQSSKFDEINREYAVVNNGRGLKAALSSRQLASIKNKMTELKKQNPVALEFNGEQEVFKELVATCLGEKQFRVIESIDSTIEKNGITIELKLKEKKKHFNAEGWVKYEYISNASLYKGNNSIGNAQASDTTTGRSKEQSFEKARQPLSSKICGKIDKLVNG